MKTRPIHILIMLALSVHTVRSELTPETKAIAKANNAFVVDLYKTLAKEPGNLVVSPFSIDTVLMMAYAGARSNTAKQMADVLHLTSGDTNVHARLSALLKDLRDTNTIGCQLDIANALWAEQGYGFLPSYLAFLHEQYDTSLNQFEPVAWDSVKKAALRKQINSWVEGKTHDKIKEIIPPSLPNDDTHLILVNAIYFKGLWAAPFDKKLTKDAAFHVSVGKSVSVPTIHLTTQLKYGETDDLRVLEMPYRYNRLSMVILLPKKNDDLADLEKTLSISDIEQLFQTGSSQEVNVSLPKFKETSGFELTKPLKDLGMVDAFSSATNADFSGITYPSRLFIQAIFHKAYVAVDEEGTEAAAATAVFMADSISVMFNADHPFLFLIKDNSTGTILFMGRVTNPLQ